MSDRQLLQQCYDMMKVLHIHDLSLMRALKARLEQPEILNNLPIANLKQDELMYPAQPEQEPVAWMHTTATGDIYFRKKPHDKVFSPQPVYTAPPQREWQGLTDEEIREIWGSYFSRGVEFARAIEAKLKEKNA